MIKKVLLAHNFYRYEGGEDAVYRNEKELLVSNGIEVIPYEKHNDDIPDKNPFHLISHLFSMTWNKNVYNELSDILRSQKPDIVHFHNTFQLISPSAYAACHDSGIPVVQTLHNFRLICPGGLLQRDGAPCEKCIGHIPIRAIAHSCYRDSKISSAAVTVMIARNRYNNSYIDNVDKYITLTDFSTSKFISGGIPANKIMIKPNFIPNPPPPGKGGGKYIIYVGRLSVEKGIVTLLEAWRKNPTIPLFIIGDGPLADLVKSASDDKNNKITWLGFQEQSEVFDYISNAELLILPSICYEGFPLTILEAYACGTPVLVSRLGNMDEVVKDNITGFKFNAGDANDLSDQILHLWQNTQKLQDIRPYIREYYMKHYSSDKNFKQLMNIYQHAREEYRTNNTDAAGAVAT